LDPNPCFPARSTLFYSAFNDFLKPAGLSAACQTAKPVFRHEKARAVAPLH
jgi:hypothetical protein